MKNSRNLYFIHSAQASNLSYLWNLGSLIIKYSNKQSLSIKYILLNHPINLYVKWGSHHFIRLIYDKNHYKLNITQIKKNIISFLVYHILSSIINLFRYYWTCLTKKYEIIYWGLVAFLSLVGIFFLLIVGIFFLPIEGILLYDAHEWIKEALSIAAETMKNWPIIPNGGGSNSIIGSTGQEFEDLKHSFIDARHHVIEQQGYMIGLIQEQAKLEAAYEEGLYKHRYSMKDLYQMHLDTKDARNEVKKEISDACAELSRERANFKNVVQSLENYSKR